MVIKSTEVRLSGTFGNFRLAIYEVGKPDFTWRSDTIPTSGNRALGFAQELVGLLTMLSPSNVIIFSNESDAVQ